MVFAANIGKSLHALCTSGLNARVCIRWPSILSTENRRLSRPGTPLQTQPVQKQPVIDAGRGTTRAEDAHGTPTQSHISPSILVYEETQDRTVQRAHGCSPSRTRFIPGQYRGTSLIRNRAPLGPYRRTLSKAVWWS